MEGYLKSPCRRDGHGSLREMLYLNTTQQGFLSTHPNQYKHNITQWKNYSKHFKEQTVINPRGAFTYE